MAKSTLQRAQRGIFREWRLYALSVFSLAVAFVCLGAALLFVVNLEALQTRWSNAGRLTVYLQEGLAEADREGLRAALLKTEGVTSAVYVARADAQRSFEGEGGLETLPVEAFPESIEVTLTESLSAEGVSTLQGKLELVPGVDEVEGYQGWTDRLARLTRGGVTAAGVLAVVVFGAVLAVVSSTVRLSLQRRKSEVEVLRLVGATERYIKGPFVLEGSIQGALGAAAALLLLGGLFMLVRAQTDAELFGLLGIAPVFLPLTSWIGLLVAGAGMGAVASMLGLRRWVTL